MAYRLLYKKQALDDIRRLEPRIRKRLARKLIWFVSQRDPLAFAQSLTKPADAQCRFRGGDYRILFDVEGDALVIMHVQHRREVYR